MEEFSRDVGFPPKADIRAKKRSVLDPSASPEQRSGPIPATTVVPLRFQPNCSRTLGFACETKEVVMRKLLMASAAIVAAAIATSAAAQIYIGLGHSPYSYGYSPYPSYGYSPYSGY